jgi:hypothetical protein
MATSNSPGQIYWSLIEPVWLPLNESWDEGAEEFLRQMSAIPPNVANLYAAHWCQSEVNNGGLFQFFYNTTGLLAAEASRGFEAIGIGECSEILTEAMRFFGDPYPRERMIRINRLLEGRQRHGRDWTPFSELDNRFYDSLSASPDRWEREADRYAAI